MGILGWVRVVGVWALAGGLAQAAIPSEQVYVAEGHKVGQYIKEGVITGGDHAMDGVIVKDIRRAVNAGFERWVIDLEATRRGENVALPRPPFYHVALSPEEKRLVFTVYGKPQLRLNTKKVLQGLKKSRWVEKVEFFPVVNEDSWTFAVSMKDPQAIEVFELSNPVRVIVDLKSARP